MTMIDPRSGDNIVLLGELVSTKPKGVGVVRWCWSLMPRNATAGRR
jgi:hypothetical protein